MNIRKSSNTRHCPRSILALAVGAAVFAGTAFSQEQILSLEEVVVTAQKRTESLEEVPISIAVFSGEALVDAGMNSANDIANLVPGMRIDLNGAAAQPSIRGVGSSLAGTGFTSNIAVYVDGFYIPSQYHTDMQLLNLAGVQVIKGPQGTLFGRNATGGAILLETLDASFDPTFEAQFTLAENNRHVINLYGSTAINDKLAIDFAGLYEESDGFIENIATGDNRAGGYRKHTYRTSVFYTNDDGLTVEFAYAHSESDDPRAHAFAPLDGYTLGPAVGGGATIVPDGYGETANGAPTAYTSESDGYYLTVEKDIGSLLFKSLTMKRKSESQSKVDLDATNIPVFAVEFSPASDTFSQEFNLSGETWGVDWVAGLYYMDYEEEFHNLSATEFPFVVYEKNRTRVRSAAVFIDATYEFYEDWFLTAGLRYSKEKAESEVDGHFIFGDIPVWGEDWKSATPRLVLRHQLEEGSSIYASYSQGFKAGMLQPSAPSTIPIDQEKIDAFEIGYKANQGSWRFDASAYYYDYTDLQVASFNGTQALVVNAGSSEIYGGDFQLTSLITANLEVTVGAAYTHARYEEFPDSQPRNLTSGAGFLQIVNGANADGNQMLRSPDWSGTLAVTYFVPIERGQLRFNGNISYSDDFYFDSNEQFKQEAYTLVSARATWIAPGEKLSVAIFGTNITDEEYISAVLPGDQAIERGYGDPATYGITVGYKY